MVELRNLNSDEFAVVLAEAVALTFDEALERAAEVADAETSETPIVAPGTNAAWDECARTIAAAIRILKANPIDRLPGGSA